MTRMDQRQRRDRRRSRALLLAAAAALMLLLGVSLYKIFSILAVYQQGAQAYEGAQSEFAHFATPAPAATPAASKAEASAAPEATPRLAVDFSALQARNPDACAWLYGEGASLHYPVVQGEDNDYYLTHLLDGTRSACGCIFLDYRAANDFSQPLTLVYGHNMNDGSMFGTLDAYKDPDTYAAHPELQLLTPAGNYRVELLAGYVTTPDDPAYGGFSSYEALEDYIQDARARSAFESEVPYARGERVLALSTCSYETDVSTFLLLGKLVPLEG